MGKNAMSTLTPNLALVTFVAIKREGVSDLLLAALKKPVWDQWEDGKPPYPEKGALLKSQGMNIIQYLWWGNDDDADKLWDSMQRGEVTLEFGKNDTVIIHAGFKGEKKSLYSPKDEMPDYNLQRRINYLTGQEGFQVWQRELDVPTEFILSSGTKTTLLTGWKEKAPSNTVIPYIQPAGLVGVAAADDFFGQVTEVERPSAWFIDVTTRPHQDKYGAMEADSLGYQLRGFVMGAPDKRADGKIECDLEFTDGTTAANVAIDIDPETGIFCGEKYEKQISSGRLAYVGDRGRELHQVFYLVRKINTNLRIISKIVVDPFGREITHSYPDGEEPTVEEQPKFEGLFWEPFADPDRKKTLEALSDHLAEGLRYLGEKIIVSDPYSFGDMQGPDSSGKIYLNESLAVFTAALVRAKHIESLTVVYSEPIETTTWEPYLRELGKFIKEIHVFKTSRGSIHDRHWIGEKNIAGKTEKRVLQIGTSINSLSDYPLSISEMQGVMADDLYLSVLKKIKAGARKWPTVI